MVGRDGVTENTETLTTREGFPLLSAQPGYPYHCDRTIPKAPNWNISSDVVPLAEPFWGYLPSKCTGCTAGCNLRNNNNKPGLGPELVRAYVRGSLAQGRSVIVVPAAVGGKRISLFDPANPRAQMWERLRSATQAALAHGALDNRIVGLFWLQGESDSNAPPGKPCRDYFAALTRVVEGVRGLAGGAPVPFVAGQLLQHWFSGSSDRACSQAALMRLATVPSGLANAALVSSAGLVSMAYRLRDTRDNAEKGDQYHFSARSLKVFGRRFYAAFTSLAPVGGAAAVAPTPSPTPRPVHACHWARSGSFPNSAQWDGDGPQLHLLLRGVDADEQWALGSAALTYDVKLVQWDAAAAFAAGLQPAGGAAAALAAGLPERTSAVGDCDACPLSAAQLHAAEQDDGFVLSAACGGYALVNRRRGGHAVAAPPGAPNAALSFNADSYDGSRRTRFTPYRFNGSYVVPLVRDEGSVPVTAPGIVRGATISRGLDGVWLPIHQAQGFPDEEARAAAEAAGRPFVALVRAVAVVPAAAPDGATIEPTPLSAQLTLAVRLPPPERVAAYQPPL
jgi:hypothetical protein